MSASAQTAKPARLHGLPVFVHAVVAVGTLAAFALAVMLYGYTRSLHVGTSARIALQGAGFMGVFLAPCWGLVMGVQVLLIALLESRWSKRVRDGRCGACGYPMARGASALCSECGVHPLDPRRPSLREHRRYLFGTLAVLLGAALAGASLCEIAMGIDEALFRREIAALPPGKTLNRGVNARPRAWPFEASGLVGDPETGEIFATD